MNTFTFTGTLMRNLAILVVAGAVLIFLGAITFNSGGGHGDDHGGGHGATHAQQEHVDDHSGSALQLEDGSQDDQAEAMQDDHAAEDHGDDHAGDLDHAHGGENGEDHGHAHDDDHADDHGAAAGLHGDAHGDDHGGHAAHEAELAHVIYSNTWTMIMFFFWIAVAAMFFLAAHVVGWAGWYIQVQKVTLSIMTLIPVMGVIGIVIFLAGHHYIFEWTHKELFDPASPAFDPLLKVKESFLNVQTWGILSIVWLAILSLLLWRWWVKLRDQDTDPALKHFSKTRVLGAVSIVLIAVINAFGVWQWIMSIEPHWYSTLFAWYNMASAATAMFAFTILILIYLQSKGYLQKVNENHYHDLGKYMFAVSVFWTYLWFSQFMLIWYGNIPEETIYFIKRMENYPVLFYGAFTINFLLPFFVLMTRGSKRNKGILMFMCIMLILGHWFDFFNEIVTPLVPSGGMGLISLGSLLLFTGFAGFVVFAALSRMKDLDSSQHPYYKESLIHHI
jgi:hypothetical protein